MTASSETTREVSISPPHAEALRGVVVEVGHGDRPHAFYERLFQYSGGQWDQDGSSMVYRRGEQSVEFVSVRRPRAFADSGYHCAYRIPAQHVEAVVAQLVADGHSVNWWREDHPQERTVTPYFHDPNGNVVQIVPSNDDSVFLDHVGIEIHMFDYCEYLYVAALGGKVGYYHGWRTVDHVEARRWAEEGDPCAPWTRKDNPNYRDLLVTDPATGELRPSRYSAEFGLARPTGQKRVPRPNGQVFLNYGPSRLALISATKSRQEPPEEQIKGTPRVIFSTDRSADEVDTWLDQFTVPRYREEKSIYLRDADGNFSELLCQG